MIGWLYRVLWGCLGCKFVEVSTANVFPKDESKRPSGKLYIMRCEKCGRMKSYQFEAGA